MWGSLRSPINIGKIRIIQQTREVRSARQLYIIIYKYSENSDNSTDKAEGGSLRSPINVFIVACRHLLINYAPAVSEVVFRHLEVVVGALKKAHIFALRLLWYEGIQVISVRAHGCT